MSPTPPAPSAAEATRARIADVAERLFRSMGYQKTAVADIARELGMSPANVYRFFPSKSAINEAIADRLLTALHASLRAIAGRPGSAEARILAVFEQLFETARQQFFDERRIYDMVTAAISEHWDVVERHIERLRTLVEALVQEGMAAGEFAPGDAAAAAIAFKHATVAWHHPVVVAECLKVGETPEQMRAELRLTLGYLIAGLKRGVR